MSLLMLLTLAQLILPACVGSKNNHASGVARVTMVLYDIEPGERIEIINNIWFKHSVTIQEVPVWDTVEDTAGNRTHSVFIKHYTYIDPVKNIYRDYRNFSDTAVVKKAYKGITAAADGGAWDFYSDFPYTYESIEKLNDTVIEKADYNRFKINKSDIYTIIYARCDIKNFPVKYFKPVSDSIGCQVFRSETYSKKSRNILYSFCIEIIGEKLSENELAVFEAWGRKGKKK